MNAQEGLLSDRTQPSAQDSDGKRRASVDDYSVGKRLKLTTTEGIGLNLTSAGEHNEIKGTDLPKGEEAVPGNLHIVYDNKTMESSTTVGSTKSIHSNTDGASSITKSGPVDNAAEGTVTTNSGDDKLANVGQLEADLDCKQSQQANNTRPRDNENPLDDENPLGDEILLDDENPLDDESPVDDKSSVLSDISEDHPIEGPGLDHFNTSDHEQEFYNIWNSGGKDLIVIPIAGGKPWNSLPSKKSATLDDWKFNIGESVYVRRTGNTDGLAKVSEIRHFGPGCYLVELAWYYTRDDIKEELRGRRGIPKQRKAHLDTQWPPDAPFSHILSSNRTINMWDTLRGKASPEVMAKLCSNKFYITTKTIRKICKAGNSKFGWMKELLYLTSS